MSVSWSEGRRRLSPKESSTNFNLSVLLKKYLRDEDVFDMDNELDEKSSQVGPRGAVVIPLGESVQRIREPLSRETYENFGQRAFEALEKAEIYDKTESGETRKRPRGL